MVDIRPCDKVIILGRQGENLARRVIFEKPDWVERFGAGTFQLIVKRNGDPAPYPADITQELTTVTWELTSADTASEGYGATELYYFVGDVLAKSEIWQTRVLPSLGDAGEEPPEPYQSWVDSVLAAAQSVEEAVGHYPYIDPTTHDWMAWDVESESWYDTGVNAKGEKGDKGDKGDTGEQGIPGEKGEQGENGYTPVRGVDYWTPEDQTAIVSDVQTAIAPTLATKADASDLADTDRRLSLLYDLTRGQAWTTETNTTPAYSKAVPSGAHAVEVESIGGHSEVVDGVLTHAEVTEVVITGKNLFDKANPKNIDISTGSGWRQAYLSPSGSHAITYGTATTDLTKRRGILIPAFANTAYTISSAESTTKRVGYFHTMPTDGAAPSVYASATGTSVTITTDNQPGYLFVQILVDADWNRGANYDIVTASLQIEAASSATPYEAYTENVYEIPATVRALTGYGQSAVGGDANTVDFEAKTYTEYGHYVDGEWVAESTPIVTDISDILADFDPLMDAEGGGTLTFHNANELPVPNEETYYINIAEALS